MEAEALVALRERVIAKYTEQRDADIKIINDAFAEFCADPTKTKVEVVLNEGLTTLTIDTHEGYANISVKPAHPPRVVLAGDVMKMETARERLIAMLGNCQERHIKFINDRFDEIRDDPNHMPIEAEFDGMTLWIDHGGDYAKITFKTESEPYPYIMACGPFRK